MQYSIPLGLLALYGHQKGAATRLIVLYRTATSGMDLGLLGTFRTQFERRTERFSNTNEQHEESFVPGNHV